MNEFVPFERYRMHGERFCPVPLMINEMMDKMKHGLLDLVKKEAE